MKDILGAVFGLTTTVITALLLVWLERTTGLSLYTWNYWLVLPVGAILAGLVAASGYYFAAKLLHVRPERLLPSMVLVSVAAFFLIHYLSYASATTSSGAPLNSVVSFGTYLSHVLTHASLIFHSVATNPGLQLGLWGYVFAALQILGFGLGGLVVYFSLQSQPYCHQCQRYMRHRACAKQYTENTRMFEHFMAEMKTHMSERRLAEATAMHASLETTSLLKHIFTKPQ